MSESGDRPSVDNNNLNDFGVVANPNGSWKNHPDERVRNVILQSAASSYRVISSQAENAVQSFLDFLDIYTNAWNELRMKVEEESRKYGFVACQNLSSLSEDEKKMVALLALSQQGSFILLGNGCLSAAGGSGTYEKIPLRYDFGTMSNHVSSGVRCRTETIEVGYSLYLQGDLHLKHTSNIYLLFYTTEQLPKENELKFRNTLAQHLECFSDTVRGGQGDGNTIQSPGREEEYQEPCPEREYEPQY